MLKSKSFFGDKWPLFRIYFMAKHNLQNQSSMSRHIFESKDSCITFVMF